VTLFESDLELRLAVLADTLVTGTKTGEKTVSKEKTELSRPWNVIVHDDPITLMTYVTMVLRRIFGYSMDKAQGLMMQVHTTGRAIVWTGAKEPAEQYVAQLHGAQLLATLEKVDA
jgi:ATP-dependent Clp protease adaptor protein ClpS